MEGEEYQDVLGLRAMALHLYQHAVVISELLVGAKDEDTWNRWHQRWVLPAERARRVLVPGYPAWLRASRIIARLSGMGRISPGAIKPGFYNDCLLAASAREDGLVLVTHNTSDFDLIKEAEPGLRAVAPFP
jgi:predicted nucleic acid-binding protein